MLSPLLDLLLPRTCAVCERLLSPGDEGLVCGVCWSRVAWLPEPRCARCGHPVPLTQLRRVAAGATHRCRWCELLPPFVRAVRSACWVPGGAAGSIVHALKYHGWELAAEGMARRLARLDWPADVVEERRALVPVPLAGTRLRERGFNQSERLACALGAQWRLPVWDDVLERGRATRSQTRLTPGERLRNVSGAFRASETARIRLRGAHLVLVDDVVTTAATLNACAATLFEGGARVISYVTFGRAPATGDRP